jgi:hypothetical protein
MFVGETTYTALNLQENNVFALDHNLTSSYRVQQFRDEARRDADARALRGARSSRMRRVGTRRPR